MNSSPDWTLLQSFITVAEQGSLSAAARHLSLSQPTLSRHVAQLEEQTGRRLFDRGRVGVTLTPEGSDLMERVAPMADAAAQLQLDRPRTAQMSGTVRITASRMVATFLLPEILAGIGDQFPGIALELVGSDDTANLLRREADIAVRMYRPTQNDVITRHLGDLALAAYATPEYLEKHGVPEDDAAIATHRIIGYDRSTLIIDGMRDHGIDVSRDFFAFRSDDQVVCWQMVRAGFGIGFNQAVIGDADPKVMRVLGGVLMGHMPIWLTAHANLRQDPRIRCVYDALDAGLMKVIRAGGGSQ